MQKKIFKVSMSLVAGAFLLLQAWTAQAETPLRKAKPRFLEPNDSAVFVQDAELTRNLIQQYHLPEFSDDGVPFIDKSVAQMGGRTYFVQRGWDAAGNCRAWAMELTTSNKLLLPQSPLGGQQIHSCSGDPCSSCSFTRDSSGGITGCKCGGSGKCNHTITEANL